MKANRIEEILDELKSLRKKAIKATQAQNKAEEKLADVEALVKALYHKVKDEQDQPDQSGKKPKKKSKKEKHSTHDLADLASTTDQDTAQI